MLEIWQRADPSGDPIDPIELVNFANPWRPGLNTPARDAVANARPIDPGSPLRCVQLPDLNPDADLEAIRAVCKRYGFEQTLEQLITSSRSG